MATSGTVGQTIVRVSDLIDEALRRAGITAAVATPDIYASARNNLYFYLSGLANMGINLWTIEKTFLGTQISRTAYDLPVGTVDVINALYRTVQWDLSGTAASSAGGTAANAFDRDLSTACTQVSTNGNISYTYSEEKTITNVGVMSNGTATYTLALESSTDGSTWTTVYTVPAQSYPDREWVYVDINSPRAGTYFRVRETGGSTLNIRELVFAWNPQEITIARFNIDDYTNMVNKSFPARNITGYWFKRDRLQPQVWIWPVSNYSFDQIVIWRHRQIQDVSALTQEVEVPQRWIESIICELALRMYMGLPGIAKDEITARYTILKEAAIKASTLANDEERDKSPIMIAPNIECYTRR